jgi:hypothetical protein
MVTIKSRKVLETVPQHCLNIALLRLHIPADLYFRALLRRRMMFISTLNNQTRFSPWNLSNELCYGLCLSMLSLSKLLLKETKASVCHSLMQLLHSTRIFNFRHCSLARGRIEKIWLSAICKLAYSARALRDKARESLPKLRCYKFHCLLSYFTDTEIDVFQLRETNIGDIFYHCLRFGPC